MSEENERLVHWEKLGDTRHGAVWALTVPVIVPDHGDWSDVFEEMYGRRWWLMEDLIRDYRQQRARLEKAIGERKEEKNEQ